MKQKSNKKVFFSIRDVEKEYFPKKFNEKKESDDPSELGSNLAKESMSKFRKKSFIL